MKKPSVLSIFFLLFLVPASVPAAEKVERQWLAASPNGPIGLFRLLSAQRRDPGPYAFSGSITGSVFSLENFPAGGVSTEKLGGKAAVAYTPFSPLEVFLAGSAFTSNDNPVLIQQVGNLDFGLKVAKDAGSVWSMGPAVVGHFQKAAGDLGFRDRALSFDFLGVLTADLQPRGIPLRLHANAGFRWDNTHELVDATADERARVLLGVLGKDAIVGGLGFEIPVKRLIFSAEYTTEQTIDTPGIGYADNPQRVTLGLRYFPTQSEALALEFASDLGMFATRDAPRASKEPTYAFLLGMAYNFGAHGRSKESADDVPSLAAAPMGTLFGQVTDARTKAPVAGAQVRLCPSAVSPLTAGPGNGEYRSFAVPAGTCNVEVTADGFTALTESVSVVAGQETRKDFALARAEPNRGAVLVQVKDTSGKPVKATITVEELPQAAPMETDELGRLLVRMPVGNYRIEASSGGMTSGPIPVEIAEGREASADFTLQATAGKARLAEGEITVTQQIRFLFGKSELTASSKKILDEVAAVLSAHPEIRRVDVGGHTDNVGNPGANKLISRKRAAAVVNYLVEKGVDSKRLKASGSGAENPIVSNDTSEGRLKNRRVEFKILEKAEN